MPHAVPFATLALGLGLMGGAVAGIHELGGAVVPVRQQHVDLVRFSDGQRCPHQVPNESQPQ